LMQVLVVTKIIQLDNQYFIVRAQYIERGNFAQLHVHVVRGVRKYLKIDGRFRTSESCIAQRHSKIPALISAFESRLQSPAPTSRLPHSLHIITLPLPHRYHNRNHIPQAGANVISARHRTAACEDSLSGTALCAPAQHIHFDQTTSANQISKHERRALLV
jgi:hypothetical protein